MKASSLPQGDGIAETLLSAEVVSFDIFDTLVKRTVLKPTDIFEDAEYSTSNAPREVCARIRVEAERDARMLAVRQGREDTTLDEIYAIIGERLSQGDAKRLKEAEISLELSCCIPYEHMKGIYDLAKKSKARVIAVTDMYLPHDVIRQILQKCGYDDLDAIFVSSECGLTKASGGLWNHVIDSLGTAPNSIVHFGDNRRSDVDRAKAAGIIAFLVRESHDFIFRLPRREMQNEGVSKLVHYLECTRPVNQDDAAFKLESLVNQ